VVVLVNASNAAERFFIEPNTVKWTFSVTQWPFETVSSVLKISVGFTPNELIRTTTVVNTTSTEHVTRYVFFTEHGEFRATFPLFAVADSSLLQIPNILNIDSKSSPLRRTFEFTLPSYVYSLEYDPDMSVLSLTDDEVGGAPATGTDKILILLIAIILGLVGIVGITITVVQVARWNNRNRKKEAKWKGITFEGSEGGGGDGGEEALQHTKPD